MRRAVVLALVLCALSGVLLVPAVPVAADSGPWGWPLAGPRETARGFDPPASRYGAGHRGVDLPGAPRAPVRASAAGRVTYAGLLAGRGVVVVSHGALRTTYEPVTAAVRLGQAVALGEVVGQLEPGHLGCPVAACLHWGLRRGEDYLDPVRLVEPGPVRLLPLDGLGGTAALRAAGSSPREQEGSQDAAGAPAARGVPGGAAGDAVTAPAPPEVHEPSWSLRAAEAPLGAAAVAALVLGISLLARPRPMPPSPASGGVTAPAAPPHDDPAPLPGLLLDLDQARVRRRSASTAEPEEVDGAHHDAAAGAARRLDRR